MNLWLAMVMLAAPARSVDGGLTEAEVSDVIDLRASDVAPCFANAKPRKKASAKYRFEVNDGSVTKFSFVDSTALDGSGTTCIGAFVEGLQFPVRAAATTIDWTFKEPTATPTPELTDATIDQLAPFDAVVSGCYASKPLSEKSEGTITLDLTVLRSGAIASATVIDQSAALEPLAIAECVKRKSREVSLAPNEHPVVLHAGWILATSERRAKKLFVPSEQRRELVPQVKLSAPEPGGLPEDEVRRVIKKNQSQVSACYQTALSANPRLEGKVAIAWTVGLDGHVAAASVSEDTMGDPAVSRCMVERVRNWTFPKPTGGKVANVTFPWIFKPAGE
jgi:TonB family protein